MTVLRTGSSTASNFYSRGCAFIDRGVRYPDRCLTMHVGGLNNANLFRKSWIKPAKIGRENP